MTAFSSFLPSPRYSSSGSKQAAESSVSVRATTKFAACSGGARPRKSVVSRMASMAAMLRVSSQVEGERGAAHAASWKGMALP